MVLAVAAMAVMWIAKLWPLTIGLGIIAIGVGMIRYGAPIIASLNKLYARLPGRFRYPVWWHRLLGGLFVAFGLLYTVAGIVLATR